MLILKGIAAVIFIMAVLFLTNEKLLEKLMGQLNMVIIESKPLTGQQGKLVGVLLVIFACVLFFISLRLR